MAKYLLHGNYVGSGIKGLQKEGGSSRRDAIGKLLSSLGGKVEGGRLSGGPFFSLV